MVSRVDSFCLFVFVFLLFCDLGNVEFIELMCIVKSDVVVQVTVTI